MLLEAYCTVLYCTVLYYTALYCTALRYTTLYCTVVQCTVLYCTTMYCTVLHMDRTVQHSVADARGSFGDSLEAGEHWAPNYSLEHVHCSKLTLVEELKRRLE